ncbi:hypothetical protein LWH95_10580 [Bacillus sp. G16]|nr:hypothetical protein [Bacillus sp. G16]MCE0740234.1 hypothetical protein [Bacillus sp. G16]
MDEADEYLKIIQEVLDGSSSEEYEIQLNTTIAYIKKDLTVVEHLYTESENDKSSMETEKFKTLCLFGETRSQKGIRALIETFRSLEIQGTFLLLQ